MHVNSPWVAVVAADRSPIDPLIVPVRAERPLLDEHRAIAELPNILLGVLASVNLFEGGFLREAVEHSERRSRARPGRKTEAVMSPAAELDTQRVAQSCAFLRNAKRSIAQPGPIALDGEIRSNPLTLASVIETQSVELRAKSAHRG